MGSELRSAAATSLLERDGELEAIDDALEATERSGDGRLLLIEGPPGIGKTALLGALETGARERGHRVLKARGSEMERDFGFGIVRQLFGPVLRALGPGQRARLFAGPVGLAAGIFGMAEPGTIEIGVAEASLYGLFWLAVGMAESGPVVLAIDDAHWSDAASLRFVRYLAQRFDGLGVTVALAARPNEPGVQAEALRGLAGDFDVAPIHPPLLSEAGTAALVRTRLGADAPPPVEAACHEATGGNPLLIEELLVELVDRSGADAAAISPGQIEGMGSERIAAGVISRAERLDPEGPAVTRAAAVLGDGADLRAVADLAGLDRDRAAAILDGLAAAAILVHDSGHGFVHPLLRTTVYEAIPAAARAEAHARAATLLAERGAEPEEIAAHLLLCEPGSAAGALDSLDAAAARAADRGAPDSAVTYLGRALREASEPERRAAILHRLGRAEVALRDPASIEHLGTAAKLTSDPGLSLEATLELIEVLSIAGLWEEAVGAIEPAMARFGGSDLPGALDLEAAHAAARGYDPATVDTYEEDLPRLLELVRGREDDESSRLRWVLAALGSMHGLPREEVLALIGPAKQNWSFSRDGRESSLVAQAAMGLLIVDALEEGEWIAAALAEDGRRRGSLLAMISSVGYRAALDQRRGRLQGSEADLVIAIELLERNELSLMVLTTFLHFCLDTIVERHALEGIADIVESLEMPPPFGRTTSGAMVLDVRSAVRVMRGDRAGALATLREGEKLMRPLHFGPRISSWRSRMALAMPDEERAEALALAEEELALASDVDSPRAEGIALRALGVLHGGEDGIELFRRSVERLRECPSQLEVARSLAELGAALRRGNQRGEARERLREATDLAQRCGAERLEERIEEEMTVAGAKPRRRAISGPDSLTPAERRVAAAAATGATNREIGQDLFVSLRTVEMHLTNTYRKLDISSRTQLAAAIVVET